MNAREAKQVARDWLIDQWLPSLEPDQREAVVGAYVMGSVASRADEAPFDETASDIDVAIVVDEAGLPLDPRYPHGRFLVHGGCALQAIFVPAAKIDEEGPLLTMLGLGCNLRSGQILIDPHGRIGAARALVLERWGEPRWLAVRTDRAVNFARRAVEAMAEADAPLSRLGTLCEVVTQLAGIVAISKGVTPTHRRALAVAQPLLREDGRLDFHEQLLTAIGADAADERAVDEATVDAVAAARLEAGLGGSTDTSEEFRSLLPRFAAGGIAEIVRAGMVREAMLPALTGVALSVAAVSNSGDVVSQRAANELAVVALRRAQGEDAWDDRVGLVRRLLQEPTSLRN